MAGPITWQSLTAPDAFGTSRLMSGASSDFQSSISALQGLLTDRQAMNSANVDRRRSNNEQSYLDYLGAFSNPDDLAKAQASGAVAQKLASYGGVLDAANVRGADQTRLTNLQNRALAQDKYGQLALEVQQRPEVDRISMLIASGDPTLIAQGETALRENSALLKRAGLQSDATRAQNAELAQKQALETFNNSRTLFSQQQDAFKQTEEARLEGIALDSETQQQLGFHNMLRQENQSAINDVASVLKLPMTPDGNVDTASLSPQQAISFQTVLAEQGIGPTLSDTEVINSFKAQLRDSGKYSLQQIDTAANNLGGLQSQQTALAATDQAVVERTLAAGAVAMKGNPFHINKDTDVQSATLGVIEKFKEDGNLLDIGDTELKGQVVQQILSAVSDGITLQDGSVVPVTPQLVELALTSVRGAAWDKDGNFKDILTDLVAANPQIGVQYEEFKNYQGMVTNMQAMALGKYARQPNPNALLDSVGVASRRSTPNLPAPTPVSPPAASSAAPLSALFIPKQFR